jgi:hypothetical protein
MVFFYFVVAFTGPGKTGDEVASSSHAAVWEGGGDWPVLAPYDKGPLTTSIQLDMENILFFYHETSHMKLAGDIRAVRFWVGTHLVH